MQLMDESMAWMRVGHVLGRRLADLNRQSDGFLIFRLPGDAGYYVLLAEELGISFARWPGSGGGGG